MARFRELALVLLAAVLANAAWAQGSTVPPVLNYQGFLVDSLGAPLNSMGISVRFRIYDAEVGGTSLWEETQMVAVTHGVATIHIAIAHVNAAVYAKLNVRRLREVRIIPALNSVLTKCH